MSLIGMQYVLLVSFVVSSLGYSLKWPVEKWSLSYSSFQLSSTHNKTGFVIDYLGNIRKNAYAGIMMVFCQLSHIQFY
jgi:hypothetical protein